MFEMKTMKCNEQYMQYEMVKPLFFRRNLASSNLPKIKMQKLSNISNWFHVIQVRNISVQCM